MTTDNNTPRKTKPIQRIFLILSGLILIVGAISAGLFFNQQRTLAEAQSILKTRTYVTPTPIPSATLPPTQTPRPTHTPLPPTMTAIPTYTPGAAAQSALPLSFSYSGDPYEISTDGESVWISYPARKLIEKRALQNGALQQELLLTYEPSTILPAGGYLWVVDANNNLIHQLDVISGRELKEFYSFSSGEERSARLYWDSEDEKLWVLFRKNFSRHDGNSGELEEMFLLDFWAWDLEIYDGIIYFLIDGVGLVRSFDAQTMTYKANLFICPRAHNMEIVGGSLWVVCYEDKELVEIHIERIEIIFKISTRRSPTFLFTNEESLLVLDRNLNFVPFDIETFKFSETVILPFHLYDFLWVDDILWLGNRDEELFQIYDIANGLDTVRTPVPPPLNEGT